MGNGFGDDALSGVADPGGACVTDQSQLLALLQAFQNLVFPRCLIKFVVAQHGFLEFKML